jgi:diacylglycerol kinase (ATP)
LIVNPHSRSADSADMREGVAGLEAAGIHVHRVESSSPEQSEEEIARRVGSIDFVILAGGDGTLHSSVPVLYRHRLPLAILPLGTANDLARSLAIPIDLEGAFATIRAGKRRKIDLGQVNGELFLNAVHVGLGVTITKELTADAKERLGVFSYLKAMIASLRRSRSFRARVEIDGEVHRLRSIQLAVGNGRFYGGGNVIDEHAAIDEGLIHLYSIKPRPLWELLLLAPLWRRGRQRRSQNTFCAAGRRIVIRPSRSMEVYSDGEPATRTPAVIEVLPGALEVLAPEDAELNAL